jgi:hypothetical protein
MALDDTNPGRKSNRELRAHYHASLTAFTFLLLCPTGASPVIILSAFRGVVAALLELLLDEHHACDEATLATLRWELARMDQELEQRYGGASRSN